VTFVDDLLGNFVAATATWLGLVAALLITIGATYRWADRRAYRRGHADGRLAQRREQVLRAIEVEQHETVAWSVQADVVATVPIVVPGRREAGR
jgi:hypothetical protein